MKTDLIDEKPPEKTVCQKCNGDGWYSDCDPHDGSQVQVQCEACYGEGKV